MQTSGASCRENVAACPSLDWNETPARLRQIGSGNSPVVTGLVKVMRPAKAGLHAVLVQLRKCLILHCNKMTKRSLLKGQWHFRRHVCIGAAGKIWGLR